MLTIHSAATQLGHRFQGSIKAVPTDMAACAIVLWRIIAAMIVLAAVAVVPE